jgi:hypothetical protein
MTFERMSAVRGRAAAEAVKETGHRDVQTVGVFWAVDDDERDVHFRAAHDVVLDADVPRHRHTFEQIYFHLGGDQRMGRRPRPAGTFAYHPESVHYGPASRGGDEPLEMIVCQFPSPTGRLFGSNEEVGAAMRGLRESGAQVERGLVVWPDGRKQDSTEAAFEWLLGGDIDYAPAAYDEPVVVHAPALPWEPTGRTGVSVKRLGVFSSRGPAATLLRLDPGAATSAGTASWAEMRFVYEGSVDVDGERHDRVAAFYAPPGEATAEMMAGPDGAEILLVQLRPQGADSGDLPALPL